MSDAVTAAQVRAARALLNWSQRGLSAASGVSHRTLARFELEDATPQPRTVAALRSALEAAGIEFVEGGARRVVQSD